MIVGATLGGVLGRGCAGLAGGFAALAWVGRGLAVAMNVLLTRQNTGIFLVYSHVKQQVRPRPYAKLIKWSASFTSIEPGGEL